MGFAYDGDADRCLAVDEQGGIITGDHILYVCGRHLKQQGELPHNTVVTTIMSNFGLYRAFDREGISYAKTAVGDKYVYEYMARNGCALGGEQSGHIIFSKYASTGDGVLTSLKLMEVMLEQKKPLSKLTEGLTIYPQVLENVRRPGQKDGAGGPRCAGRGGCRGGGAGGHRPRAGAGIRHRAGAAGHGGSAGGRYLPPVRGPRGGRDPAERPLRLTGKP